MLVRRLTARWLGAAAVAPMVLACASHSRGLEPGVVSQGDDLVLEVDNRNWSDVLIYVIHDGTHTRFLQVSAAKSVAHPIPAKLVGSDGTLRLLVHRIGGVDDYLSSPVSVRTGRTLALTLESNLERSSLGVW